MTLTNFIIVYLCIGCIKGVVEFYIAKRAFKGHPHADVISGADMFLTCIRKNAHGRFFFSGWPLWDFSSSSFCFGDPEDGGEKVTTHAALSRSSEPG